MKPVIPKHLFVTGIGTGVGKTIASAVLVKALGAHYWKPVQTGAHLDSDRSTVTQLCGLLSNEVYKEVYALQHPSSPHYAAAIEGKQININEIIQQYHTIPKQHPLIIEGAGGALVPLNTHETLADLVLALNCAVVVVASQYLGSINHTLLTIEALKKRNILIAGILFSGETFLDNHSIIEQLSGVAVLGQIAKAEVVDTLFIEKQANLLRQSLQTTFDVA